MDIDQLRVRIEKHAANELICRPRRRFVAWMEKSTIWTLCFRATVLALFLPGLSGIGRAQDLAITHATVFSAPDVPPQKAVTIVIRHGWIAEIGEHPRIPKGVRTISCDGCFVLAGFWN